MMAQISEGDNRLAPDIQDTSPKTVTFCFKKSNFSKVVGNVIRFHLLSYCTFSQSSESLIIVQQ